MADVLLQSAKEAGAERFEALQPSPGPHFEEGGSFYKAGIATISYIGSTWYTFTAPPMGEISKLDRDRL